MKTTATQTHKQLPGASVTTWHDHRRDAGATHEHFVTAALARAGFLVTCLSLGLAIAGCTVPAVKLAGITEPGAVYEQRPDGSRIVKISSDFEGEMVLTRSAETGEIELHVSAKSNASEPTRAQGERADHLVELRKIEAERDLGWQRLLGQAISAAGMFLPPSPAASGVPP